MSRRFLTLAMVLCLTLTWALPPAPPSAQARRPMRKQVTCPICGHKFTAIVDVSGTMFGRRLDLRPVGPYPAPWMIPVCPRDHFVMYKGRFSPAEIARLKPLVLSPQYQALAKDGAPSYYLLSRIFKFLGKSNPVIAYTLLKATWQVEGQRAKWTKYANETLVLYDKIYNNRTPKDARWRVAALLSGEFQRRLGRFDDAKTRFIALKQMDGQPKFQTGILAKIIGFQLELIGKRDSKPHRVPRSFFGRKK